MKKIICFLVAIAAIGCTQAKTNKQQTTVTEGKAPNLAAAVFQQQPKPNIDAIPAYQITTMDGTNVTQASLKPHKPVMIIYFSPDCSHCKKLMTDMQPYLKDLTNVQIVLITWIRIEALAPFDKEFGLSKYPNITMGTEGQAMKVQQYYQLTETPYIAFYNHKGKLVKDYRKPPKMDELMEVVKKG